MQTNNVLVLGFPFFFSNHSLEFVQRKKGEKNTGTAVAHQKKKLRGLGSFRRPPLAGFGVDTASSVADHTMGVGGTAVGPRRFRWRSGSRRSSAGETETSIVGKSHLDMHHHHYGATFIM